MVVNQKNTEVEVVYTSLKGNIKIYGFKDINNMSPMRGVTAMQAKRFATLNLTRDELARLVDKACVAVNTKQNMVEAMAILYEIGNRNKLVCEENTLLDLANIYLMIEGEDMHKPTEEINKKKIQLCEENFDLKCFFLQSAAELMNYFSGQPSNNLLTYLEETKVLAERIYRFIPKTS